MFRKLAEAFQNEDPQSKYINQQNQYFNTLPNMIPSATSGLKGFDVAIQSVDTLGTGYQQPVAKYPNNIFKSDSNTNLNAAAQQCAASSIDELIAIKNPNASIGCGWMYTPPNQGSPYPVVSQGTLGTEEGPIPNLASSNYKKWFFDLQLAKKQLLLDKCKALKACGDVDSDVFNGSCGYCTDTNQGVPIDSVGQPLYSGDPLGSCNSQSIVISSVNCPVPASASASASGTGPQPIIDKTCVPVNGRLSADCLYSKLLSAGCSDNGTLAMALASPSSPSNYIQSIANGTSVKIYNRVANPPLKLDVFNQGATTVDIVLQEARRLAGNASQPANTAIGAAARDLCLQSGAINNYDFCGDLADTTIPPFDVGCLQQLFRKMGGQPSGKAYPSQSNIQIYNNMTNLGAIKQFINQLIADMKNSDYNTQRAAMIQLLGISPERLIKRAPYTQGVEVIWGIAKPGVPNQIMGILKRTIETNIVQFSGGGVIPQLASTYPGFTQYCTMIQIFDVRASTDFSTKFQVTVDDGFWIAVNQPNNIDKSDVNSADQVGLFSNLQIQGPSTYFSNNCSNYYAATPNITKMFYTDAGGGGHTFQIGFNACSGQLQLTPPYYSLTLEQQAPFINFEVNKTGDNFEDTRNPGVLSQLTTLASLDYHNRTDERNFVPGNKGFIRLTNNRSSINIMNIAYQAWSTFTLAFRLQSMPIKDAIVSFWVNTYFMILYLQPVNGNTSQLYISTNITQDGSTQIIQTGITCNLNSWNLLEVAQTSTGFDVYCDTFDYIKQNNNYRSSNYSRVTSSKPIITNDNYGLYVTNKYSCNVCMGGSLAGSQYSNGVFQFDIAWAHFFDWYIGSSAVMKEVNSSWQFTDFPDTLNTYSMSVNSI